MIEDVKDGLNLNDNDFKSYILLVSLLVRLATELE